MGAEPAITLRVSVPVSELRIHSFIVKIWIEEAGAEAGPVTWRGHVTHVPSGERRHLKELDDLTHFIQNYLVQWGVRPNLKWRILSWKRRLRRESGT
jgi:hypothetical protein